ncbi:phosphoenolpyruvate carboxylase [Bdellovibrio sp. NC01]|uniref:phosphoenolpyruvate carboxylase n=1 Tax=Bdellovibrio sp. NC01 TaxID=2220073 RepID=UPI00115A0B85|nr:phosphoenolpyruvate carboxylase [Bdellovibrio sp. NC01]QDK36175.1 phosphoenolpyruvate carboxylase [Bdellovibrio sp. NC01]
MQKELSPIFTHLVDWSVSILGQVIELKLGKAAFNRIEKIRRYVKTADGGSLQGLLKLKKDLSKLSAEEQYDIAHAFGLMLEIINSCEAAYRVFRLRQSEPLEVEVEDHSGRIIHVLTAHPTESRNPEIIVYLKKIQNLLEKHLEKPESKDTQELFESICLAWVLPLSKQRKPSVMDEAEYIYSLSLHPDIIDLYLEQKQKAQSFYIRTWVGGDKDGHPGVNEITMHGSLQLSRKHLQHWFDQKCRKLIAELQPALKSSTSERKHLIKLVKGVRLVQARARAIKILKNGDAKKIRTLQELLLEVSESYDWTVGSRSEILNQLNDLFKVFPGLVVPLELREDSALVHEALKTQRSDTNIERMLKKLSQLSLEHDPRFYVRGFVLSQCESAADIQAGIDLTRKYLGKASLPVVPLFESAHSLENCVSIIEELLSKKAILPLIKRQWSSQLEVMLGYSDSAKENGSFPSRFLIQSAVLDLEKLISKKGLTPIFFHGSGGSVERGGGSIQEQTEWWPQSALTTVKMTIQGEVIYRNYTAKELLSRHLQLLTQTREEHKGNVRLRKDSVKAMEDLATYVRHSYQDILSEPEFLDLIEHATPYMFMKDLRLGSRPSKRQGNLQLKNLRAIPWVLCWTQTRALFPSWWGVGHYWSTLSRAQKAQLKRAFKDSALLRSYIKVLGFTLEKIELDIFSLYLHSSKLSKQVVDEFDLRFRQEFELCKKCVREISGERSLLWYRPWLETSIALRSPLIHPLNILQLIALETKNIHLLRETVTGVASGMLTTG